MPPSCCINHNECLFLSGRSATIDIYRSAEQSLRIATCRTLARLHVLRDTQISLASLFSSLSRSRLLGPVDSPYCHSAASRTRLPETTSDTRPADPFVIDARGQISRGIKSLSRRNSETVHGNTVLLQRFSGRVRYRLRFLCDAAEQRPTPIEINRDDPKTRARHRSNLAGSALARLLKRWR